MKQWNKKKLLWILPGLTLLLTVILGLVFAQPLRWWWTDVTFYQTERTETELKVKAFAESHDLYFAQYPESLIRLLERNPETEEFVLNYPLHETGPVDLSSYEDRDTIPLFLQWDSQWGYSRYGSDFLAITGCGPTCLAMAGFHLTGDTEFTPEKIAVFAEKEGYYEAGYGSSWTLISEGAGKLGLHAKELPLVEGKINAALEAGHPVVLAMGKGDFTTTGHYILLTGLEAEGYRVNDPNSIKNSQTLWPYSVIEGQIRNIWEISLPE